MPLRLRPDDRARAAPRPGATRPQAPIPRDPGRPRGLFEEQHDFGDLLYGGLRRAPWYVISIALHAAFLGGLTLVDLGLRSEIRLDAGDYLLASTAGPEDPDLDEDDGLPEEPDLLDELDPAVPDLLEPEPVLDDLPLDSLEQPDEEPLLPASPEMFLQPETPTIGLTPEAIGGVLLGTSFGKDAAGQANARAADAIRGDPFARRLLEGLRRRTSGPTICVLSGEYDSCERVLAELELEHGRYDPEDLARGRPAPEVKVLLYNCTPRPLPVAAASTIERWVRDGGYLLTTDWGIETILEQVFSDYVRPVKDRGRTIMTKDEVISIHAVRTHPLLRGLPRAEETSRWWLENSTQLIDIVDRENVEVLIESNDLEARHGSRYVAVTFRHGRGRVVHVLGHLYQKEGNLRGTFAMQRILLNFVRDALGRK